MEITVNVHVHLHGSDLAPKVDEALRLLTKLAKEMKTIMLDLTELTTAVNDETTVEQSAITLLNGLSAKIQELIDASGNTVDPAALKALADQINQRKQVLAAAIAANTLPG